jgi:tRNA pseudouridine65 synthase
VQAPNIIGRSEHWVAVDKPSGMVVHRSRGANDRHNLVSVMRDLLGPEVFPVNRLDRQTSGAIVMALSRDAARELSAAFAERRVEKTYEAVVRGWPPLEPGEEMVIDRLLKEKAALTRVEVMTTCELAEALGRYPTTRLARVRLHPKTGVTHQLRRHMQGWGYPIINDKQHGDTRLNPAFFGRFGVKRLLLHSRALTFPFAGERVTVEAQWNGRALGLLQYLGLDVPSSAPGASQNRPGAR